MYKATTDTEKVQVLKELFASVFTVSQAFYISHVTENSDGLWGRRVPPSVREKQVQDYLIRLNTYKPDDMESQNP